MIDNFSHIVMHNVRHANILKIITIVILGFRFYRWNLKRIDIFQDNLHKKHRTKMTLSKVIGALNVKVRKIAQQLIGKVYLADRHPSKLIGCSLI